MNKFYDTTKCLLLVGEEIQLSHHAESEINYLPVFLTQRSDDITEGRVSVWRGTRSI